MPLSNFRQVFDKAEIRERDQALLLATLGISHKPLKNEVHDYFLEFSPIHAMEKVRIRAMLHDRRYNTNGHKDDPRSTLEF